MKGKELGGERERERSDREGKRGSSGLVSGRGRGLAWCDGSSSRIGSLASTGAGPGGGDGLCDRLQEREDGRATGARRELSVGAFVRRAVAGGLGRGHAGCGAVGIRVWAMQNNTGMGTVRCGKGCIISTLI